MRIQPIVEGHGEVGAVPVLLRRLLERAQIYEVGINEPIRQPRGRLVREESLRRVVRLALLQPGCAGILILFDADDDCPKTLAPPIQAWAQAEAREIPCAVVMPVREYEAWFLASLESLRGIRGIGSQAVGPASPEEIRDAKGLLDKVSFCGTKLYGDGGSGGFDGLLRSRGRLCPFPLFPPPGPCLWQSPLPDGNPFGAPATLLVRSWRIRLLIRSPTNLGVREPAEEAFRACP